MGKLPNVDKMFTIKKVEQRGLNLLLFSMSKIKENIQVNKAYLECKCGP